MNIRQAEINPQGYTCQWCSRHCEDFETKMMKSHYDYREDGENAEFPICIDCLADELRPLGEWDD